MRHSLTSVILPVYNGRRYLRESIESVFAQTSPNVELIAVNDGSTDDSADILTSYGKRITFVEQENQGVAAARNAGMRHAQGEFIAFLDQDDWWLPEKIEKQVALFQSDERIGLVHTDGQRYDEFRSDFVGRMIPDSRPELLVGDCYRRLVLKNEIVNSSVMVRASLLDEVGLCDLGIRGNTVQDYDLWLRIARVARLGFVPEPLTVFRVHGDQGQQAWANVLTEEARLLERVIVEDGLNDEQMRHRMAALYDHLATTQLDDGERHAARRNFGRSLRWRATRRAMMLWGVSLLPLGVIRRLHAARTKQQGENPE